jgi:metabolite-proton symporter
MSQQAKSQSIVKIAATAAVGATIEWYDFFIYGTAAALVFPHLFFPSDLPPLVAQIAAFGTFSVGFIARPLGAACFGHFGDLFGRKRALVFALITMGLSTAAIGLLPSHEAVGIIAPILLVVLRFVQGLAVGGQWGGAALLAIESAPQGRRGYYGSFVQIGVPLGVLLANLIFFILDAVMAQDAFLAWGWRIPFLLSLLLVCVGVYVQLRLEDSPEFAKQAEVPGGPPARPRSPIIQVILSHPKEILLAGGAFIANNTCFYIAIAYVVAYGTSTLGLPQARLLEAVMIGSLVMVPALILFGRLSDHVGRLRPFMVGAALTGLWSFAFFPLIESREPWAIILAISVELALIGLMYGPQAALFAELFPVEVRYSGASLGYQIGTVFGGALAPIVATALFAQFGESQPIALYLAIMCLISFICTGLLAVQSRARRVRDVNHAV